MNRLIAILVVYTTVEVINARPQQVLPFIDPSNSASSPGVFPARRPLYLLRPNGDVIYIPGGLPIDFNSPPSIQNSPIQNPAIQNSPNSFLIPIHIMNPFPRPSSTSSSAPLLAFSHHPNQFNSDFFPNGFFKERATTTPSSLMISIYDTGNKPVNSLIVSPQRATDSPTTTIQPLAASSATSSDPSSGIISSAPNTLGQADGNYKFGYSVNNKETGDVKSQEEKRVNGVVTGYYMLMEADGTFRKVNYTADDNGFRASISKLPQNSN